MYTQQHNNEKYYQALQRVDEIKKFYKHLLLFIAVMLFLSGRRIYKDIIDGVNFEEAIFDPSNYKIFWIWGIFLLIHGVKTFGIPMILGKDWEKRKIEEEMRKN